MYFWWNIARKLFPTQQEAYRGRGTPFVANLYVWSDPKVLKRLQEDYIVVALYVDDKTSVPEDEWVLSSADGKLKKTVGKIYADLQIHNFNINAQPYYVLLGHDGEILVRPRAYDLDVEDFVTFLNDGSKKFEELYGH